MSTWGGTVAEDDNATTWGGESTVGAKTDAGNGIGVQKNDDFFNNNETNAGFGGEDGGDYPRGPPGPCRKCNQEGHKASECPNQKCTSCGEIGHSAGRCPTPKCNICNQEGHIAFNCEDKVCNFCNEKGHIAKDCEAKKNAPCRNCGEVGHRAAECENPRKRFESLGATAEKPSEEEVEGAWAALRAASDARDLDLFKPAFFNYVRLVPESTLDDLQSVFKGEGIAYNLVAVKKDIGNTQTIIDLQGRLDKEFVVTFQLSLKGRRTRFANQEAGRFPENEEENLQRLREAGFVEESFKPYCNNCNERGHGTRTCPQELQPKESDTPKVVCVNCGEEGHRSRDCREERKKPTNRNACRNCGEEGHMSKECEKPRDLSTVQCRKCEEMGHYSKDCPTAPKMTCRNCDQEGHRAAECPNPRKVTCNNCGQEGHMRADCSEPRKIICNNCEEEGHVSRECPKPRDPAKMKCRNCDQMGHGARDCPQPRDVSRVKCNECEQMGHFARNCPNKDGASAPAETAEVGGGSGSGTEKKKAATSVASGDWMSTAGDTTASGW